MLLNKAYYTFKFLIPRRLQIQLRRYYVNRKRSLHADIWPIDHNAGKPLGMWGHDPGSCPHIPNWPNGKKFALVLTMMWNQPKVWIKGNRTKEALNLHFESALTYGDWDINENWQQYRDKFLKGSEYERLQ